MKHLLAFAAFAFAFVSIGSPAFAAALPGFYAVAPSDENTFDLSAVADVATVSAVRVDRVFSGADAPRLNSATLSCFGASACRAAIVNGTFAPIDPGRVRYT